ncbi:MAG: hypothetical protein KAU31_07115, partial [Spirochaetaceae bacterium]|nr:hypothetical protein [Spirochaetaceae bacterium]
DVDNPGTCWFGVPWTLDAVEVDEYDDNAFDVYGDGSIIVNHQCIMAEISAAPGVEILTSGVPTNMMFGEASTYSHQAIIGAFGYDTVPGETEQRFLLRIHTREWSADADDDEVQEYEEAKPGERAAMEVDPSGRQLAIPYLPQTAPMIIGTDNTHSFVEYVVKGYRFTGGTITFSGVESEVVEPVGSYGYVIHHDGLAEGWDFSLEGPGVEQIDETTYVITIPAESSATVIDTITPLEPPRIRAHTFSGIAIPVGTLAGSYGIGPNVIVGGGYYLTPEISLHGLFGYNLLLGTGGGPNGTLMSGSLVGRYHYGLTNTASVFGGLGVGYYFGDALASPGVGVSGGVGCALRLMRLLELEAGLDYHYLPGSGSQYLHGHAGASLRF